MNSNTIFITGIGTGVGKTVVSAILVEAHNCSYWKPIQAGDLHDSDSLKIEKYCTNAQILSEKFRLKTAASPHLAAELDGVHITLEDLNIPHLENNLLIEGAGGLLVPLNNEGLVYADVIKTWNCPLVLVSRHYLGSINHTLLSLEILNAKQIPLMMLIWLGDENKATEDFIGSKFPELLSHRIPLTEQIDRAFIKKEAEKFPYDLFKLPPIILKN